MAGEYLGDAEVEGRRADAAARESQADKSARRVRGAGLGFCLGQGGRLVVWRGGDVLRDTAVDRRAAVRDDPQFVVEYIFKARLVGLFAQRLLLMVSCGCESVYASSGRLSTGAAAIRRDSHGDRHDRLVRLIGRGVDERLRR